MANFKQIGKSVHPAIHYCNNNLNTQHYNRGAPLHKIDGRASAIVIQNDTRAGRMAFAHNILLEISNRKCERRRRERNFYAFKDKCFYTLWVSVKFTFALARVSSKTTLAWTKRRSHMRPCDR